MEISQEKYEQFISWSEIPENRQAMNQEWEKLWQEEWLKDIPALEPNEDLKPLVETSYPEIIARLEGRYPDMNIDEGDRQRNLNYFGGQASFMEKYDSSAGLEREAIIIGAGFVIDQAEIHPEAAVSLINLAGDMNLTQVEGNIRRLSRTKYAQENKLLSTVIEDYKLKRSFLKFRPLEKQFEIYQYLTQPQPDQS